jgi:hypothetical protein
MIKPRIVILAETNKRITCTLWEPQDRTAVGIQPVQNYNTFAASVFFVSFVFVGCFLCINLFTSFIVNGFYSAQVCAGGTCMYVCLSGMCGRNVHVCASVITVFVCVFSKHKRCLV